MQLPIIITQKVTCVTSHHLHFSICSTCPSAAQTQAVDVDSICQQHIHSWFKQLTRCWSIISLCRLTILK